MKLRILSPSSLVSVPPLHTWPDPIKRTLLTLAVVLVLVAYLLLIGGMIALVVVLAKL